MPLPHTHNSIDSEGKFVPHIESRRHIRIITKQKQTFMVDPGSPIGEYNCRLRRLDGKSGSPSNPAYFHPVPILEQIDIELDRTLKQCLRLMDKWSLLFPIIGVCLIGCQLDWPISSNSISVANKKTSSDKSSDSESGESLSLNSKATPGEPRTLFNVITSKATSNYEERKRTNSKRRRRSKLRRRRTVGSERSSKNRKRSQASSYNSRKSQKVAKHRKSTVIVSRQITCRQIFNSFLFRFK